MKLSSLPHSVMATRNVRTPNPTTKRYSLDKAIQIKFALGSGSNAQGQAYTDALKDWDAGKKGKLSDKIDSILAQVERKITDFIIKQMVSGTYDLTMMKSSPSVVENVLAETPKEIVRQMFPHRSKPDMRLKVNKRLFDTNWTTAMMPYKSNRITDLTVKGQDYQVDFLNPNLSI